jgi:hypothetical protein
MARQQLRQVKPIMPLRTSNVTNLRLRLHKCKPICEMSRFISEKKKTERFCAYGCCIERRRADGKFCI